jgi:dethiobiotin synthetase
MTAIFVTGTGTDVGKTFVTVGLIRYLRAAGRAADAIKPIVSGFNAEDPASSDPAILLEALGRPASSSTVSAAGACVARACEMARKKAISRVQCVGRLFRRAVVGHRHDVHRGCRRDMVPLDETHTVIDWMIPWLPLLLVAGSYVGTSATLARYRYWRVQLDVAAVVVSESAAASLGDGGDDRALPIDRGHRHPAPAARREPHPAFGRVALL